MHTSKCLQKDHTKPDSLYSVKNTQPQPETAGYECSSRKRAGPGEVKTGARCGPPYLSPPRCAETTGEDRKHPTVLSRKVAQDEEDNPPHETEKYNAEDDNLPGMCVLGCPQD